MPKPIQKFLLAVMVHPNRLANLGEWARIDLERQDSGNSRASGERLPLKTAGIRYDSSPLNIMERDTRRQELAC